MVHDLEYIVKDALMMCDKGADPGFFRPTYNMTTKVSSCLATTKIDMFPIVNIPCFGVCSMTQQPCLPVPTVWQKTYKVTVRSMETLLYRSFMPCGLGGKIEIYLFEEDYKPTICFHLGELEFHKGNFKEAYELFKEAQALSKNRQLKGKNCDYLDLINNPKKYFEN